MPLVPWEELPKPRRRELRVCTDPACADPACGGGCYYTPERVQFHLGQLARGAVAARDRGDEGRSGGVLGNRQEGQWAIRADLGRALAAVERADEGGALTREIVWLAYVGRKSARRAGRFGGLSDEEIGEAFGMDARTVGRHRRAGLRLMVLCLNPNYRWEEERAA